MPDLPQLTRARLQEVAWNEEREVRTVGDPFEVQFNPETLKVTFSNQQAGGQQAGGGSVQFVGAGTTKLAVELVFDVTVAGPPAVDGAVPRDVRRLTRKVAHFMIPERQGDNFVQRGVRFHWGSFLFEGVMGSMNETLELFSADGRPLRAAVAVELSQQEIKDFATGDGDAPGTQPQRELSGDESIQGAAARAGRPEAWREDADRAGVENPRLPPPGTRVLAGPARR